MKTGFEYTITARPTIYRGLEFRSRIEATWAAFFDVCGWGWQYEPFDMSGWVPDFLLHFEKPTLVEVKPTFDQCAESISLLRASFKDPKVELLVLGSGIRNGELKGFAIGWISEWVETEHAFALSPIYVCGGCHKPTITHSEQSFRCRLSGCYDGDHYLSGGGDFPALWNQACNATKFKPR